MTVLISFSILLVEKLRNLVEWLFVNLSDYCEHKASCTGSPVYAVTASICRFSPDIMAVMLVYS